MFKITILTPVFNCKTYIRDTIESVISQKGEFELEYIIKDGGSTDGTLDIINEYKNYCIIISEKDESVADAIRIGMSHATGDIGGILMGDDLYYPGALSKVIQAFQQYKTKHWLYGRCAIIDGNGDLTRNIITVYKNIVGYFYLKNTLLCENYINEPSTFWKMDLWYDVGGWNSIYNRADDYHLWVKMAQRSKAISLREYLSKFRRHRESTSENDFEYQMAEELCICNEYGNTLHLMIHKFLCAQRKLIYNKLK